MIRISLAVKFRAVFIDFGKVATSVVLDFSVPDMLVPDKHLFSFSRNGVNLQGDTVHPDNVKAGELVIHVPILPAFLSKLAGLAAV